MLNLFQIKEMVEKYKLGTIIIYNGDFDTVCNFIGDEDFVDSLGYELVNDYQAWTSGQRIGGWVKRYEGITFTTVRAAGHMVPGDQPEAALEIVKELIGQGKLRMKGIAWKIKVWTSNIKQSLFLRLLKILIICAN